MDIFPAEFAPAKPGAEFRWLPPLTRKMTFRALLMTGKVNVKRIVEESTDLTAISFWSLLLHCRNGKSEGSPSSPIPSRIKSKRGKPVVLKNSINFFHIFGYQSSVFEFGLPTENIFGDCKGKKKFSKKLLSALSAHIPSPKEMDPRPVNSFLNFSLASNR